MKMKYAEFLTCTEHSKEQLLAHSYGSLLEDPPEEFPQVPAPPFLMMDRVTKIERNGSKGFLRSEKDVRTDEWFFQVHFRNDPVQPGCLGVDAIWQLLGLYCSLNGASGAGRALGCKDIEFSGQIRPSNKLVTYEIDIRRFSIMEQQGVSMAIGDGRVYVDNELIYTVKDAKAGLFRGLSYREYPHQSATSQGGKINKD